MVLFVVKTPFEERLCEGKIFKDRENSLWLSGLYSFS